MPGKNCFAFLKVQRQRCVFLKTSSFTIIVLRKVIGIGCLALVLAVVEVAVSSMKITAVGVGNW